MDAPPAQSDAINILLVHDRPENLMAMKAVLESPEFDLVTVTSGHDALRAILRDEFALILLDVMMPGMDGFEVASLIKQHRAASHIPIIFLTGLNTDIQFIYRGYSVGAVDYLVKPVDPDVLKAKVIVFADLYRKERKIKRQAALLQESAQRERALQLAQLRQASDRHYESLADAIPQIVWTARPDGFTRYYNRRWLEYTGMELAASTGWGWTDALHPDDLEKSLLDWRAALSTGNVCQSEYRLRRVDGEYRWHLCRAVAERGPDGAIVGWLGTCTDIDDRKRSEDERVRARDDFLSTASHELKTPITALQLQVKHLLRTARREVEAAGAATLPADRVLGRLEDVDRQIDRLTRLINNLFDVSRITAGRIDLDLEEVDLTALVRDSLERIRPEAERAGCAVSMHLEGPVRGLWDRMRLEQVVTNLLTNAFKYGHGKPIEIMVEGDDHAARLTVLDHGVGIAAEDQERIFQRFERVVSSRHIGGLGLGLWITRQLVTELRGEIRVVSEPGEGLTFIVELPRRIDVSSRGVEMSGPIQGSEPGNAPGSAPASAPASGPASGPGSVLGSAPASGVRDKPESAAAVG